MINADDIDSYDSSIKDKIFRHQCLSNTRSICKRFSIIPIFWTLILIMVACTSGLFIAYQTNPISSRGKQLYTIGCTLYYVGIILSFLLSCRPIKYFSNKCCNLFKSMYNDWGCITDANTSLKKNMSLKHILCLILLVTTFLLFEEYFIQFQSNDQVINEHVINLVVDNLIMNLITTIICIYLFTVFDSPIKSYYVLKRLYGTDYYHYDKQYSVTVNYFSKYGFSQLSAIGLALQLIIGITSLNISFAMVVNPKYNLLIYISCIILFISVVFNVLYLYSNNVTGSNKKYNKSFQAIIILWSLTSIILLFSHVPYNSIWNPVTIIRDVFYIIQGSIAIITFIVLLIIYITKCIYDRMN
jgi:hypothetical protein